MGNVFASSFRGPNGAAPFLKWAGGKQWLVRHVAHLVPADARYFEPFLGAGSVFFATQPPRAFLSDNNSELVETYEILRDDPMAIIGHLSRMSYGHEAYYVVRGSRPRNPARRAARFIYLNRTCWNGLYRVNRRGEFNVPFGRFARPTICDSAALLSASRALQRATLRVADFESAIAGARRGDFVFLDPPYTVKHSNNGFLRYNERLFSWADQERLARKALRLSRRGCRVLVTNANHRSVLSLYPGFFIQPLHRLSNLAGNPHFRGLETELILSSFPFSSDREASGR